MNMSNSIIETRTTKMWLDDEGIIRIVTKPGITKQTLSDAVENMEAVEKLRQGKKRPLFIDLRAAMSTDAEGRRYYSRGELAENFSAGAFIIESPLSRVIGSLFLGVSKPPFPVMLFNLPEKALDWLRGFLEKEIENEK
jgi:hypothetical protein